MLRKSFSASGLVALATVAAVWIGCGSDDPATVPQGDTDGGSNTGRVDSGRPPTADSGSGGGASTGNLDGGVQITYGTCPAFTACGGDLAGNWKVTGGCLDKSTFEAARASCDTLQESNVKIEAAGTVSFTANEVTRNTTQRLTGTVFVPTSSAGCSEARGYTCAILQFGLTSDLAPGGLKFDTAACTDTNTPSKGCNCDVAKVITDKATQPYTTSGNAITTSNPAQTYDYCVNGSSNQYLETTSTQALKLYVTISKQ